MFAGSRCTRSRKRRQRIGGEIGGESGIRMSGILKPLNNLTLITTQKAGSGEVRFQGSGYNVRVCCPFAGRGRPLKEPL